jgi:hypothetical protein
MILDESPPPPPPAPRVDEMLRAIAKRIDDLTNQQNQLALRVLALIEQIERLRD